MAYLICLIGLFTAAMGCSVIMQPTVLSKILHVCKKTPFLYLSSGIKTAIGILFLIRATSCTRPWIIILIGILTTIGSLSMFFIPKTRSQRLFEYILRQPQWIFRVWGLTALAFGILIIWAGWPK
ncbi:hypothetical protein ACQ9LF_07855 [Anaerohalosphaeraceae bacterium U12dextr]|jgi:uncharacterized protein YjeT (DUF2065 family)